MPNLPSARASVGGVGEIMEGFRWEGCGGRRVDGPKKCCGSNQRHPNPSGRADSTNDRTVQANAPTTSTRNFLSRGRSKFAGESTQNGSESGATVDRDGKARKRRSVELALKLEPSWSEGKIAEWCGGSQHFVSTLARGATQISSESGPTVGRDGRTYNTSNIGRGGLAPASGARTDPHSGTSQVPAKRSWGARPGLRSISAA
jgi:hypothetical protein